jgi:hypothetical protein
MGQLVNAGRNSMQNGNGINSSPDYLGLSVFRVESARQHVIRHQIRIDGINQRKSVRKRTTQSCREGKFEDVRCTNVIACGKVQVLGTITRYQIRYQVGGKVDVDCHFLNCHARDARFHRIAGCIGVFLYDFLVHAGNGKNTPFPDNDSFPLGTAMGCIFHIHSLPFGLLMI